MTNVRHFVRAADPVTIEDVLDHFDHAIQLVGIEHVGVGSDLDLRGRDAASHTLKYDIAGLNHPRRMYDLVDGLIRRGYTNSHIELILGGNFQIALSQIWV
jgi:membrane dipeptidase